MALTNFGTIVGQDTNETSPIKRATLGQVAFSDEGRQFRYAQAGSADLAYGTGMKSALANKNTQLASAAKAGDGAIDLKDVTTVEMSEDGLVLINNRFYEYDGISGKTMSLRDPLFEDIAANAAVQIRPNDFDDMVTTTSGIKAYAKIPVPAGHYFWCEV